MLKEMMEGLRFSKGEARVIAFIGLVIASGYVIRNFRNFADDAARPFDYSGTDSTFINRTLNNTDVFTFPAPEDTVYGDISTLANKIDSAGRKATDIEPDEGYSGIVVNINTANASELESLPGIGEATAARIIQYRESKGNFKRIEDLMKVKGIGKKKFEKLKNLLTAD